MREAPNWFYERLPYLYVLGGVLAATGFDLTTDKILGIVLALASLAVFRLRIHYRPKSTHQILFRLGALR